MKKKLFIILFILVTPIITYLFSALVLSSILIGKIKNKENTPYLVYVVSSNIHTDFIFPLKNELYDWTSLIPMEPIFGRKLDLSYISIGWGSKEFFFEMKNWDPRKIKVILKAVFIPSESAVHVDFLKDIPTNEAVYPLRINRNDYLKLVHFILRTFDYDSGHKVQLISEFTYYGTDRFFKSPKKYHLFNTCNMWTNEGLKSINWKRPVWSPFKYGIDYALKE